MSKVASAAAVSVVSAAALAECGTNSVVQQPPMRFYQCGRKAKNPCAHDSISFPDFSPTFLVGLGRVRCAQLAPAGPATQSTSHPNRRRHTREGPSYHFPNAGMSPPVFDPPQKSCSSNPSSRPERPLAQLEMATSLPMHSTAGQSNPSVLKYRAWCDRCKLEPSCVFCTLQRLAGPTDPLTLTTPATSSSSSSVVDSCLHDGLQTRFH